MSRVNGSIDASTVHVTDSSNATFTVVSAVTGRSTALHALLINAGANETLTIQFGGVTVAVLRVLAASPVHLVFYPFFLTGAANQALTITKGTAATAVNVTAWYTTDL